MWMHIYSMCHKYMVGIYMGANESVRVAHSHTQSQSEQKLLTSANDTKRHRNVRRKKWKMTAKKNCKKKSVEKKQMNRHGMDGIDVYGMGWNGMECERANGQSIISKRLHSTPNECRKWVNLITLDVMKWQNRFVFRERTSIWGCANVWYARLYHSILPPCKYTIWFNIYLLILIESHKNEAH